jgi:hypothetical protein
MNSVSSEPFMSEPHGLINKHSSIPTIFRWFIYSSFGFGIKRVAHSIFSEYISRNFGTAVEVDVLGFASIRFLDLVIVLSLFGFFLIDL